MVSGKSRASALFNDERGKNRRTGVQGDILVVSQFTLFASTKKGIGLPTAARPGRRWPCRYMRFVGRLSRTWEANSNRRIWADMQVTLANDGR